MKWTEGKWEFKDSDECIIIVGGKSREYIASVQIKQIGGGAIAEAMESNRKANAKRICTCVNSHDELVEACESAQNFIETGQINPEHKPSKETELNMALLGTEKEAMLAGIKQALANARKS